MSHPRFLLATLLALCALAVPAQAAKDQIVTFEAPRDLLDPSQRDAALAELDSLGVRHLRIVLYWKNVAPQADARVKPKFDATDPAGYAWGEYEPLIAGAAARGWSVLLTISGPVPRWATNGARDNVTRPSPNEFRKFVTAVSQQFGERVSQYSIWNEPNHPQFLSPQYGRGKRPLSPGIYRKLYAAGLRGLEDSQDNKPVLLGETAPIGTGKAVAPLTFLRGALCLNSRYRKVGRCGRLRVDGVAHHAYTRKAGPYFVPSGPNDVTIGVLPRLKKMLDRAARAGMLRRGTKIHLTEFGIQSEPDPFIGVSLQRQEEYRAISEKIAWDDPRVASFSQYLLRDDDPVPNVPRIARYGGFESGLRTAKGKAKISLDGFRLPLVGRRTGSRVALWGLIRPGAGVRTATLQQRDGSGWKDLRTLTTNGAGYWRAKASYRRGREWRVVWQSYAGAPTRAYSKP